MGLVCGMYAVWLVVIQLEKFLGSEVFAQQTDVKKV